MPESQLTKKFFFNKPAVWFSEKITQPQIVTSEGLYHAGAAKEVPQRQNGHLTPK